MLGAPSYFGDSPDLEGDAMAAHVRTHSSIRTQQTSRGVQYHADLPHPLSFLRPMTPYGDTYTPSYTRYRNSPSNSYNNPLFPLFNDRRPAPKVRSTLYNTPGTTPGLE